MLIATGLVPGAAYVLHDYTVIQIVAITGSRVRYRMRRRAWPWHEPRLVERSLPKAVLAGRIRAEIDGGFFPELVAPSAHRFSHAVEEVSALRCHLARRSAHRPFAPLR